MIDNLKVGVVRHPTGQKALFNPRYLDFAAHYGFQPVACNVRKGNEKGRVENGVGYVKKNFLNGLEIPSFAAINPAAVQWRDTVANVRIHGETNQKPAARFEPEKSLLKPLPPMPYDWALRAADSTDEFYRLQQRLEMVWSGPLSGGSDFRRTEQALLELIETAVRSIIVVTFAACKVPIIAAALVAAAKRGVKISLILESTAESEGTVTFNAIKAMGTELAQAASVFAWPMEKRGTDAQGNRGALHVKCAVVDDEVTLISSANLTEHAMNLNMELGILVRGGDLPRSLAGHLRSLIQSRVLVKCNLDADVSG